MSFFWPALALLVFTTAAASSADSTVEIPILAYREVEAVPTKGWSSPKSAGSYDPATGTVTLRLDGPLKGARQQVVWGEDRDGHRYTGGWTFYLTERDRSSDQAKAAALADLPLHHTQTTRTH